MSTSAPSSASPPPGPRPSEPTDLRRFYNPKPYSEDPGKHVPEGVPSDVPIRRLAPIDAPAQMRPDDWRADGKPRLRFFWPAEYAILTALADALIAPPAGEAAAVRPEEVALNVDRYLAAIRSPMRLQIRIGLRVLNLLPLASGKPPLRFLGSSARRAWCRRFESNRGLIVPKVAKLKSLVYLGYYTDPRTDARTGYESVLNRDTDIFRRARQVVRRRVWADPAAAGKT